MSQAPARFLIVSSDEYNEVPGSVPWALTIERSCYVGWPDHVFDVWSSLDQRRLPGPQGGALVQLLP